MDIWHKRSFIFFVACFFFVKGGMAQYVTIPDGNFVQWLNNSSVAGCMIGYQLDTTCQSLLNDTIVNCYGNQIHNLDGIKYFKNIKYLDCSYNDLISLPLLPSSLYQLICSNNQLLAISSLPDSLKLLDCAANNLIYLPNLPSGIGFIYCQDNQITTLPFLPNSLLTLNCEVNQLDSLPELSNSIDTLICSNNSLTKLPAIPNSLQVLICQSNQLGTLPTCLSIKYVDCQYNFITDLPIYDSIQYLFCGDNQIHRLPSFPNSLIYLDCSFNNIDSIFFLPNSITELGCEVNQLRSLGGQLSNSLQILSCSFNLLTTLPPLPQTLINIACDHNLLTGIPQLPQIMSQLFCRANPDLQCLPKLTTINFLSFDSTAITCLPNFGNVTTSVPPLNGLAICDSNNTNGCAVYASIPQISEVDFTIHPNPASDDVSLTLNEMSGTVNFQLMDMTERDFFNTRIANTNYQFSVKQLPEGLYFVRLTDEFGGAAIRKLIVAR